MRARAPARLRSLVLVAALGLATSTAGVGSAALPWDLPPPGTCEPEGGLRALGSPDAPPAPFARGQTFSVNELELLRAFLPAFIWEYRERFFYEGMRLEIGDCFADYSPPSFFQAATQRFAGRAKLTEEDGLEGYEAGLPFPASGIDAAGASAGFEWAWNFEMRYQGAGFWGKFRTTDMVGRDGRGEPFLGEIFKAQTAFRSDRAKDEYRAPGARGKHWVAGGLLFEPFDARHA